MRASIGACVLVGCVGSGTALDPAPGTNSCERITGASATGVSSIRVDIHDGEYDAACCQYIATSPHNLDDLDDQPPDGCSAFGNFTVTFKIGHDCSGPSCEVGNFEQGSDQDRHSQVTTIYGIPGGDNCCAQWKNYFKKRN